MLQGLAQSFLIRLPMSYVMSIQLDGAPLVSTVEQMINMNVPGYVQWGEKNYEKWIQDEYLQNYPEYIEGLPEADDGTYAYATDYLKYVYLAGFLLMPLALPV